MNTIVIDLYGGPGAGTRQMASPMKRVKKAIKAGRRVHFLVEVVDSWTGEATYSEGFSDINEAIEAAKRNRQEPFVMDGPYRACSVHYQDTDGPRVLSCDSRSLDLVPPSFAEIKEYMESING